MTAAALAAQSQRTTVAGEAVMLVSFIHQLPHAFGALFEDRRGRGVWEEAPVTVFVWCHRAALHRRGSDVHDVFANCLAGLPWVRLVFPGFVHRASSLSPFRMLNSRAAWIRTHWQRPVPEVLYFSHDASADHTAQALMQAFPSARRVCYGDPPGFLHPENPPFPEHVRHRPDALRQGVWATRLRGVSHWLGAHEAIIAVDFRIAGTSDCDLPVRLLPASCLRDALGRLQQGFTGLTSAELQLLDGLVVEGTQPFMLLLGNFTGSRMCAQKNEIALYAELCAQHVPVGATIIVKPHAGSHPALLRALALRLPDYHLIVLPDPLGRLPVEFLSVLLSRCHVLSVSSASALLGGVLGINVRHVLTEDAIRRYFLPAHVQYMLSANQAIAGRTQQVYGADGSGG